MHVYSVYRNACNAMRNGTYLRDTQPKDGLIKANQQTSKNVTERYTCVNDSDFCFLYTLTQEQARGCLFTVYIVLSGAVPS